MHTIANENLQAFANYANKSAAHMNSIKTLKEQIRYMKATHTVANENISNLT